MDDQLIFRIIFFSLAGLLIVVGAIVFWVYAYKKWYYPKKYKMIHYKTVNRIVNEYDYRLINKFYFPVEEGKNAMIDHIIVGDKFFYIVLSHYYNGSGNITGNINDKSLILTDKKGKKYYIDNPYKLLNYFLIRFSTTVGLDKRCLIGIVLTNNSCDNLVKSEYDSFFVCKKKNLSKLIKSIENRPIGKLNDEQLQKAVLLLDKLNRRKNEQ